MQRNDGDLSQSGGFGQFLHFFYTDIQYCLGLEHIVRVLPIVQFHYVPGCPDYMRGLITLRGHSLSVIDLAARLGQESSLHRYTIDTPILLCTDGTKEVGMIVEEVVGVETVSNGALQTSPVFEGDSSPPFKAVIMTERGQSMLLDVGRVLDIDLSWTVASTFDDRRHAD